MNWAGGADFDATGKYKLDYACDFMIAGNCTVALNSWKQRKLQKISTDAKAALAKDQANDKSLKFTCYLKTQALVQREWTSYLVLRRFWSRLAKHRACLGVFNKFPSCFKVAFIDWQSKGASADADGIHDRQCRCFFCCLIDKSCPILGLPQAAVGLLGGSCSHGCMYST